MSNYELLKILYWQVFGLNHVIFPSVIHHNNIQYLKVVPYRCDIHA